MSEHAIRLQAFDWLRERSNVNAGVFTRHELEKDFRPGGSRVTLMGASGIWIPKGFSSPISITTVKDGPYPDSMSDECILSYKYRGTDPDHRDNVGLRRAYKEKTPLIYFKALSAGRYSAFWPVYIIGDYKGKLQVKVDLNYSVIQEPEYFESQNIGTGHLETMIPRRYTSVQVRQRMHQSAFRERVITAYRKRCTICGIKHEELLDAAHIIPDNELKGDPIVQNGLSLCKIHHASFDRRIIGISPDYEVKVREDVLEEVDGDMLKYGLQKTEGRRIILPPNRHHYPDKARLEVAFRRFLGS